MFEHRSRLSVPVMAGVGAAFDFLARDGEASSGLDAGERARIVLPPHARTAPSLAPLPRQWIKIPLERLFGIVGLEEILKAREGPTYLRTLSRKEAMLPKSSRLQSTALKTLLLLLGIGAAAALLEGVLRLYNPFQTRIRGDRIILAKNKTFRIKNEIVKGLDPVITVTSNSLGFRGSEPH